MRLMNKAFLMARSLLLPALSPAICAGILLCFSAPSHGESAGGGACEKAFSNYRIHINQANIILNKMLGAEEEGSYQKMQAIAQGEPGPNGKLAHAFNYTAAQLRAKARILKEAGFSQSERWRLIIGSPRYDRRPYFMKEDAPFFWWGGGLLWKRDLLGESDERSAPFVEAGELAFVQAIQEKITIDEHAKAADTSEKDAHTSLLEGNKYLLLMSKETMTRLTPEQRIFPWQIHRLHQRGEGRPLWLNR